MHWLAGLERISATDAPLAELTWYGLGGPARWLLSPGCEEELATILRRCAQHDIDWRVLGRGANVLVRDEGFDGAVIRLSAPHWQTVSFESPLVTAGGGTDFPGLVKDSVDRGLAGLDNLAGIPGTVGGIIRMNAGGKYGTASEYVSQVRLMTRDGEIETRTADQLGFAYRHCELDGALVLAATFELTPADRETVRGRFRAVLGDKGATQPPMGAHSAGCIFKNPPGEPAGKLIDVAGLKGQRIGGATISERHANFIVAHPGACARDVLDLIDVVRKRVRSATGVELELEIEVW